MSQSSGSLSTLGHAAAGAPGKGWPLIYLAGKQAAGKRVSKENVSAEMSLLPRRAPGRPRLAHLPSGPAPAPAVVTGCDRCTKSAKPQGPRLSVPRLAGGPLFYFKASETCFLPALPTAEKLELKKK